MSSFHLIVITYSLSDLLPKLGGLRAAVAIHHTLLQNIMRLPMTFFYVNPMGRLLSRFSKDINVVDQNLPRQIDNLMYHAIQVNASIRLNKISGGSVWSFNEFSNGS